MSDIEKRALIQQLETNAVVYELLGESELPRLLRRAAAVLTPPEGFVLVPVELTPEMYCAFVEQWFTKVRAIDDTEMEDCYAALLAARPEVSGG
jgi:hypothetical protein